MLLLWCLPLALKFEKLNLKSNLDFSLCFSFNIYIYIYIYMMMMPCFHPKAKTSLQALARIKNVASNPLNSRVSNEDWLDSLSESSLFLNIQMAEEAGLIKPHPRHEGPCLKLSWCW